MSVRIPYVIWDSESDTYRRGVTIYETRPVYALGPIQSRYGDGSAAWERERWVLFNDIGQPEITSIRPRKNSPLDKMSMPYEDSDQAIVMDLDGVTREYEISGTCGGTAEEINLFIAKMEMLLNGAQMDEESLRFIQRYPNQVPARVRWDNGWRYGDEVGGTYPADWAGDSMCGLNIGVAIESFDWEFTTDAADEINLFVAKMEMLLNGAQMDEESLRFIQRYPDQVPARVRWDNGWKYGDEVGSTYPADWAGDSMCGLNIGVAIESFDWEFTTDAADEITWTISITEGVTW